MIDILRIQNGKEAVMYSLANDNASVINEIMGREEVNLDVVTDIPLDLRVGDYVRVAETVYTLNREPNFEKVSAVEYKYDLLFEGPLYRLMDKLFVNSITSGSNFAISRTLEEFVKLVVDCINTIDPGWSYAHDIPSSEPKVLTIDAISCRDVLSTLSGVFDVEFYLVGKEIHFVGRIENNTGLVFEQGKGKGLYSISQQPVDNENTVTRVYPYGGTQNVMPGKGDAYGRVCLPEKFLENFSEYSKIVEKEVEFTDIFPRFKGSVESVSGEFNKVIKCDAKDLNVNDYLINGTPAKINFLSGDLMGESFDFLWNNVRKEITLKTKEDASALADADGNKPTIPNANKKAERLDTFNFTDINMPESYYGNAVEELRQKATEWLTYYSQSRVKYALQVDYRFLRGKRLLKAGDLVTIKIPETGTEKILRITSLDRNLKTGKVNCTVSNYLEERWEKKIEGQIKRTSESSNSLESGLSTHLNNTAVHLVEGDREVLKLLSIDEQGRLKVDVSFYSVKGISAYGPSLSEEGGSGILSVLNDLTDVNDSNRATGDLLTFNGTHWVTVARKSIETNLTGYATEVYVNTRINNIVDGAPAAFDTLKEIADVLQGNVSSIGDILTALGTKWTQDNALIANWNAAYSDKHTHTNKAVLDSVNSPSISNWNLAYANNHTHTNKVVLDGITNPSISNWNLAYANNHTHANKSVLDGITVGLVANWNMAFTWGNHASSGYLKASDFATYFKKDSNGRIYTDLDFYSTKSVSAYGAANGGGSGSVVSLNDLTDVSLTSSKNKDLLAFNGTHWVNITQSSITPDLTGYATESWINDRFIRYLGRITATDFPITQMGYGYVENGWHSAGPAMSFGAPGYVAQLQVAAAGNVFKFRRIYNNVAASWVELYHTGNFTPANYLPLSGGTMTGYLRLTDNISIISGSGYGLLFFDGANTTVGAHTGTTHLRSGATNLIHKKATNDYIVWDASNANLSTTDWAVKNLTSSGYLNASQYVSADTVIIRNTGGVEHLKFSRPLANYITAPTGGYFVFTPNGNTIGVIETPLIVADGGIYPGTTNLCYLGTPSNRWSTICGVNGSFSGTVTAPTFTGSLSGNASTASLVVGTYTGGGGAQPPSYVPSGRVRFNMMNLNANGDSSYKDWILMDTYTGGDVPFVTGIGVNKSGDPRAFIMSGPKGDTNASSWVTYQLARIIDNVASASKLHTPRALWGQPFDGTSNVSGALTGVTTITTSGGIAVGGNVVTNGLFSTTANGCTLNIGSANTNYVHFNANPSRTFHFSNGIAINGTITPYLDDTFSCGGQNHRWLTIYGYNADFTGLVNINPSTSIGNYTEGIRVGSAPNNWSLIILGAVGYSGTSANSWIIGKNPIGELIFDRSNSVGETGNGMRLDTTGNLFVKTSLHSIGGWFSNSNSGTGLYNIAHDARWSATANGWTSDKNIYTSKCITAGSWFYSTGNTGWFNETHGGGIYMVDSTWIRTYGGKSFYCDQAIQANRFYTGYDAGVSASMSCSNWFRSSGSTGWLNTTYGGGWYMTDGTYLRSYGSKSIYTGTGHYLAAGTNEVFTPANILNNGRYRVEQTSITPSNCLPVLSWSSSIAGQGYITRMGIGSYRPSGTWGRMYFSIGTNDAGTSSVTHYMDHFGIQVQGDLTMMGTGRLIFPDGNRLISSGSYIGFLTQAQTALSIAVGGITVSDTYSDISKRPAYGIYSKGNIISAGELTAYSTSDMNLKTNFKPITDALDVLKELSTFHHTWNAEAIRYNATLTKGEDVGMSAQQIQKHIPSAVRTMWGTKYLGVNYVKLIPLLTAGINELASWKDKKDLKIEELERRVKQLENQLNIQ